MHIALAIFRLAMSDPKEAAATPTGPEGDAPPKTAKQLEKEAKKQAKLEKLKQKQEKLSEKASKAKDKKEKPDVSVGKTD